VTQEVPVIDFLGLPISAIDAAQAAALVAERDPALPFAYVVTPNAQHMVRLAAGETVWLKAYQRAWLRLCDGHVVQRVARLVLGQTLPYACGSDVTELLLHRHIKPDDSVTVIGDSRLQSALAERFGLRRVAVHNPPFGFINDGAAMAACLDFLAAHPARFIFLAVGSPQSELLARLAADRNDLCGVALSIGGSLAFAVGMVKRAPPFVRKMGLEGLYRLIQRPRGHFRRVFIESMPILWIILRARLGGRGILPVSAPPQSVP